MNNPNDPARRSSVPASSADGKTAPSRVRAFRVVMAAVAPAAILGAWLVGLGLIGIILFGIVGEFLASLAAGFWLRLPSSKTRSRSATVAFVATAMGAAPLIAIAFSANGSSGNAFPALATVAWISMFTWPVALGAMLTYSVSTMRQLKNG